LGRFEVITICDEFESHSSSVSWNIKSDGNLLRFLSRNKLYTAIEAVGLAVSLAFVILIGSYVVQQYEVAKTNPAIELKKE